MASPYQITKPVRLCSEVYNVLLKKLLSLQIQPGERIGVDRLARDLGISQTPIREALSQLEVQGLVVKVHLSGYRAAPQLTRKQFDDLCELRLLIEPAAAAQAATLITPAEMDEIVTLATRMREPHPEDPQSTYNAFAQDDARFHAAIAKASRNELYYDIVTQQRMHLHLFRLRFYVRLTEGAIVEHADIIGALARKSAGEAAMAMRLHIENASSRFRNAFE